MIFLQLVGKEIKYQLRSITFYMFAAVVVLFYITQFVPPGVHDSLAPVEQKSHGEYISYGSIQVDHPVEKMRKVYFNMHRDLMMGETLRYNALIGIHHQLTREQKKELMYYMKKIAPKGIEKDKKVEIATSYQEFLDIMQELDKKLGGSSLYSDRYRPMITVRPKTYQEATEDFQKIVKIDKITNAYGRLLADYLGVTAGFFPVFLAAFVLTRDKRYKMTSLIYSRPVSIYTYVFAKYIGVVISVVLCYTIIATHATVVFAMIGFNNRYVIDIFGFYRYIAFWVLPTVLFVSALGIFISVVFGNGFVAIPLQFWIWVTSLLPLYGDYRFHKFVIRFNSLGRSDDYCMWKNDIQVNRVFYVIISLMLALTAAKIYSWKKKKINS